MGEYNIKEWYEDWEKHEIINGDDAFDDEDDVCPICGNRIFEWDGYCINCQLKRDGQPCTENDHEE